MKEELIVALSADIKDLKAGLDKANGVLDKFGGKAGKTTKDTGKNFSAMGSVASSVAGIVAGAFSIQAIASFGNSVVDTTSKFQNFEAVLSNTLGSNSAAQTALRQISDFAAKTPFQVDELTGAFVKLANQGFKPTMNEMRSMGDLAASTGKSFDQLAEAILDAQTNEYERLKEFGVRAKDMGDKVQFTFKGVKTEVEKSSEAIRGYILTLGNAEGVSGAMSKMSKTLGGQISNLKDSFTQLQNNIGALNSGSLNNMVALLQKAVGYFNELTSKKVIEQKLAISVLIDGKTSQTIVDDYNKELSRIGDIKDVSKLQEHLKYINTNLQFFQQAMVNETDAVKRDFSFAYFNLFKEARNAANGQMVALQNDIKMHNLKLAEIAKEANKKNAFKNKISFDNTINNIDPNANVDLSSLAPTVKEVNDLQAGLNLVLDQSKELEVIGGVIFTPMQNGIKQTIVQTSELATNLNNLAINTAEMFASGLGDAFAQSIIEGENFRQSMEKVFKDLGKMIIAQIVKMLALKALMALIGGPVGAAGSVAISGANVGAGGIGSFLSGIFGNRVSTGVSGGYNSGGSVEFEIRGDKLYGVLQNYTTRLDRIA